MQDVQPNIELSIELSNERFTQRFRLINSLWVVISFLSVTLSTINVFSTHPNYLHDWHGPTIIILAIITLGLYCLVAFSKLVFRKRSNWPPPFIPALVFWCTIYTCVVLLSLLDPGYTWTFFIVLGLSFGLFRSRILMIMAGAVFITFCLQQGLFTLPATGDKVGTVVGIGLSFFSMTLFCIWMQHLISERYERNILIAELTQAHAKLEEANRKLAESSAQEQELAVLRERTRLAREMHDTLGHALALISIKLEAARRLRDRDPERSDRELEATGEIVRASMNDLRASIANLRSPALEREPACRALSRYAREMSQRAGLQITYELLPDIEGLPAAVEEALWKVGQEALTNVEKHAHAQNVTLHISSHDGYITMRIEDNGVGLPAEMLECQGNGDHNWTSPLGHYGLSGMYERVESIGGHIALHPADSHGTIVEVELPLVEAPLEMPLLQER